MSNPNLPTGQLNAWERLAYAEIGSVLYELSHGCFESKESLVFRLRVAAESIEILSEAEAEASASNLVVLPQNHAYYW